MTEFQKYILDSIDCEELDIWEGCNADIKLNYVYAQFIKEKLCALRSPVVQQAEFSEWLAGLPSVIHITYKNDEIIELGKKYGFISNNASELKESLFPIRWFDIVSKEFFKMLREI